MSAKFKRKSERCSRQKRIDGFGYIRSNTRRRVVFSTGVLFVLSAIFVLSACSSSDPEILQLDVNLFEYADDPGPDTSFSEQLSIYVKADDPDGRVEINDLYIYFDERELVWHLDAGIWDAREESDGYWIGSSVLFMPGGAPFFSGTYRVVLVDLSGREGESSFTIPRSVETSIDRGRPEIVEREGAPFLDLKGSEEVRILLREERGELQLYRGAAGELSANDSRLLSGKNGYFVENRGFITRLASLDPGASEE